MPEMRWSALPDITTLRPAFWAAYGPVDESTRARARYVAVANYGVSLWAYALDVGHEALAAESRGSLFRAF